MDRTLHFWGWNSIFHLFSQSDNLSRSSCNIEASLSDVMVMYTIVSSANSLTVEERSRGMSFI